MMRHSITVLGALALCGCGFFGNEEIAQELRTCGADSYVDQLGTPLGEAVLPRGPEIRVVGPGFGSLLQANDDPSRLNLRVDEASVIVGVYCG